MAVSNFDRGRADRVGAAAGVLVQGLKLGKKLADGTPALAVEQESKVLECGRPPPLCRRWGPRKRRGGAALHDKEGNSPVDTGAAGVTQVKGFGVRPGAAFDAPTHPKQPMAAAASKKLARFVG